MSGRTDARLPGVGPSRVAAVRRWAIVAIVAQVAFVGTRERASSV